MAQGNKKKQRLDAEIISRGCIDPGENATAYIMAGEVLVDGQVEYKPGRIVSEKNHIEIKKKYPYVSRGALKIERAFTDFQVEIKGKTALDVGISTGGFSDYLLQHGALRVTGVDVNIDQVDYNLKKNDRLQLVQVNARYLKKEDIDYEPDIITIDVSFISVTKILPALAVFPGATIVSLIKPQFEAHKKDVGPGGVIKDENKLAEILEEMEGKIEALGFTVLNKTLAGVKGRKKGNQEYFFLIRHAAL